MRYVVRDPHPGPPSLPAGGQEHGTLPEAQQAAWDIAVARGLDPARLSWTRYTKTTWGLMLRTKTGVDYTYIGIEEGG